MWTYGATPRPPVSAPVMPRKVCLQTVEIEISAGVATSVSASPTRAGIHWAIHASQILDCDTGHVDLARSIRAVYTVSMTIKSDQWIRHAWAAQVMIGTVRSRTGAARSTVSASSARYSSYLRLRHSLSTTNKIFTNIIRRIASILKAFDP